MKDLETYVNESELIEINASQSGLGKLIRKILKLLLGDYYVHDKYNPTSEYFSKDDSDEFLISHRKELKHEKPNNITDKSAIMKALKETQTFRSFIYLSTDYENNPKRYENLSGLISLPISHEDFGKNAPYIVALYSIENKTIDFKCVEIWCLSDDEMPNIKQLYGTMKKLAETNKCNEMKITFVSKSSKKDECSYPKFKEVLSKDKENDLDTSTGEGGMYYYTYTVKVKK